MEVTIIQKQITFIASFIYGLYTRRDLASLWSWLRLISNREGHKPWVVLGDFNVVKTVDEKMGGLNSWSAESDDFVDCCIDTQLDDLRYTGHQFTWSKGEGDSFLAQKLDRVLVNPSWLGIFGDSIACFLDPGSSDHSPMKVQLGIELHHRKTPFKFFDFWSQSPHFLTIVADAWKTHFWGSPPYRFCQKLKEVKRSLKELNSLHYSNLHQRAAQAKVRLHQIQELLRLSLGDPLLKEQESQVLNDFIDLSRAEESFFRQKSRISWLVEGDSNTSFFHNRVKERHNKNKILSLSKEDNSVVYEIAQIHQEAVTYYQNLFNQSVDSGFTDGDMEFLGDNTISQFHSSELTNLVSREEIKNTLFSMDSKKAPGPDGFNVQFFKLTWHILGEDFLDAVQHFFITGRLLKELNHTSLSLIPKVVNPSRMCDYRPIACCNVMYKCISKLLANRIKKVLPTLIDKAQTAFIPDRSISDNILLAQDLLRNYHRSNTQTRCTIKVDFLKAFDTVNWAFLFKVMQHLKFPSMFINWIKECICSPKFSLNINGELTGFFGSSGGLRQGDPVSACLFVIIMEALSRLLNHRILQRSNFVYHWRCSKTKLSHLCFADDILLFCGNSLSSAMVLQQALLNFASWSGLKPNLSKSVLYIAGSDMDFKLSLCRVFNFQLGDLPVKYLGLPLITTKLSALDCKPLVDSMLARIKSWTARPLSFASRLQLLKSVCNNIHTHWTCHLLLPMRIINKVEQIMRDFLWKGHSNMKGGSKVAWKTVSRPFSEGGLGLKRLSDWNSAAMMKHLWKLIQPTASSSWAIWAKLNLLKGRSIWEIKILQDSSWTWRKILSLRDKLKDCVRYHVSNGQIISL